MCELHCSTELTPQESHAQLCLLRLWALVTEWAPVLGAQALRTPAATLPCRPHLAGHSHGRRAPFPRHRHCSSSISCSETLGPTAGPTCSRSVSPAELSAQRCRSLGGGLPEKDGGKAGLGVWGMACPSGQFDCNPPQGRPRAGLPREFRRGSGVPARTSPGISVLAEGSPVLGAARELGPPPRRSSSPPARPTHLLRKAPGLSLPPEALSHQHPRRPHLWLPRPAAQWWRVAQTGANSCHSCQPPVPSLPSTRCPSKPPLRRPLSRPPLPLLECSPAPASSLRPPFFWRASPCGAHGGEHLPPLPPRSPVLPGGAHSAQRYTPAQPRGFSPALPLAPLFPQTSGTNTALPCPQHC